MDIPGKSCRKINISRYARDFHEDDSAGIEFADSSNCAVCRVNFRIIEIKKREWERKKDGPLLYFLKKRERLINRANFAKKIRERDLFARIMTVTL